VLKASEFVPVAFEATVVGFALTKATGRLAARLLAKYGDLIDDEAGLSGPVRAKSPRASLQLLFNDYGLLTVTPAWATFQGSYPGSDPWQDWVPGQLEWAVELLASILTIQKQPAMAVQLELTWLIWDESSTKRLIDHLGLSKSMNGFFATSNCFEIRGDTTTELPGLFPVECEFTAGRLEGFESPENVGVQIKYWSPDNRGGDENPVDYTRSVIDQFFATAPRVMHQQLERFFPAGGAR
jgi:hypothetical protein